MPFLATPISRNLQQRHPASQPLICHAPLSCSNTQHQRLFLPDWPCMMVQGQHSHPHDKQPNHAAALLCVAHHCLGSDAVPSLRPVGSQCLTHAGRHLATSHCQRQPTGNLAAAPIVATGSPPSHQACPSQPPFRTPAAGASSLGPGVRQEQLRLRHLLVSSTHAQGRCLFSSCFSFFLTW